MKQLSEKKLRVKCYKSNSHLQNWPFAMSGNSTTILQHQVTFGCQVMRGCEIQSQSTQVQKVCDAFATPSNSAQRLVLQSLYAAPQPLEEPGPVNP